VTARRPDRAGAGGRPDGVTPERLRRYFGATADPVNARLHRLMALVPRVTGLKLPVLAKRPEGVR
jgi:hypothetical protein